jgi:hypothetical protein
MVGIGSISGMPMRLNWHRAGCELMIWLLTLHRDDTTPHTRLRAYYMDNSEEQMALDWVSEISDHTDSRDFERKLILCVEAEYVTSGY